MARNLSREKNEILAQETDVSKKFQLLEQWLNEKDISLNQYNNYISKIINRAIPKPPTHQEPRCFYRTSVEAKLQNLIERLRSKLNSYLNSRNTFDAKLSDTEIQHFAQYIEEYFYVRSKINQLLIIGLRYPDKKLNKLAEEYILKLKIYTQINQADFSFWTMLWSDNFVPLNAIRIMLNESNETTKLNPCFTASMLHVLKPLIEYQRDKEILRLKWAKSLQNKEKREKEVTRKQHRLDAFDKLLSLF